MPTSKATTNQNPKRKKRGCNKERVYKIINDELYKASVTALLLKCITFSEGKQILKEIHEGSGESCNTPVLSLHFALAFA